MAAEVLGKHAKGTKNVLGPVHVRLFGGGGGGGGRGKTKNYVKVARHTLGKRKLMKKTANI